MHQNVLVGFRKKTTWLGLDTKTTLLCFGKAHSPITSGKLHTCQCGEAILTEIMIFFLPIITGNIITKRCFEAMTLQSFAN